MTMIWWCPLIAIATMALLGHSAAAQVTCGSYAQGAAELTTRYRESRVAVGVQKGDLIELWTSQDGATWTLLLRMANDQACIIGAGESWQVIPPADTKT